MSSGKESFGPGGPYAAFAGHDATYNLAVMTLKKQTVDTFAARQLHGAAATGCVENGHNDAKLRVGI